MKRESNARSKSVGPSPSPTPGMYSGAEAQQHFSVDPPSLDSGVEEGSFDMAPPSGYLYSRQRVGLDCVSDV